MKPLLVYLLIINALGLALMLADKYKAKKNLWRISEATLLGVAAVGGSIGILMGMHFARHKTKHPKFTLGIPIILAIQIVVAIVMISNIK